jgi:hypothetical protein
MALALALTTGVISGYGSATVGTKAEAQSCAGYGRICRSTTDCCSGLWCHFDGFARYCRF